MMDPAIQRTHGVGGRHHPLNQALAFRWSVLESTNNSGDRDLVAGYLRETAPVLLWGFSLIDPCQFFFERLRHPVVARHFVDQSDGRFSTDANNIVSDFFFVKNHKVFDRARPTLEISADRDHFLNHDGRARNGHKHAQMPILESLCNLNFPQASKKGDCTHFPEVKAYGIVGLIQRIGRQLEIYFLASLKVGLELPMAL